MIPARDVTKPQLAETALALVCDDRARGEQLLEAIDLAGGPIFDVEARIGGWEIVPARTIVFWEEDPDLSRLRRRIRLCRARARVVVIVETDRPDVVELALREGATVIGTPGSDELLASELELALDGEPRSVFVDAEELAAELDRALSRKLHRPSPRVRIADPSRLEALVERIANLVLAEARGVAVAAPIHDLDWETASTAVQTKEESGRFRKRAAQGAPDRDPRPDDDRSGVPVDGFISDTSREENLAETSPYEPPTLELIEEVARAAEARTPPPTPAREVPRRVPPSVAIAAVLIVASAGALALGWLRTSPADPVAEPPASMPEVASPSVVPAAPPAVAVPAEPLAPAEMAARDPEPQPAAVLDRAERARRASIRARAHQRHGRPARALRSAHLAVRLAPRNASHRALLEELEDEPEVTEPEDSAILEE